MSINQIRLYDLFRKELRLPDDKAAAFVMAVGDVIESEADGKNHSLATKDDMNILKQAFKVDIHSLDLKLTDNMHSLDLKLTNNMHSLGLKLTDNYHSLELRIERSKTDIYKAMFWTGIVQLIAILGGVLAIVKFVR